MLLAAVIGPAQERKLLRVCRLTTAVAMITGCSGAEKSPSVLSPVDADVLRGALSACSPETSTQALACLGQYAPEVVKLECSEKGNLSAQSEAELKKIVQIYFGIELSSQHSSFAYRSPQAFQSWSNPELRADMAAAGTPDGQQASKLLRSFCKRSLSG